MDKMNLKLIYVDESGNTSTNENSSKFLCLSACLMSVSEKVKLEKLLREVKDKYYKNKDIEFKSNFLRYANPDRKEDSILKLYDKDRYTEMMNEIKSILISADVKLISVVIDKKLFWKQYPSQNPYETAYSFLLERMQMELDKNGEYGIVIIDPREGGVEKSFIGDSIKGVHHKMRFGGNLFTKETPLIVEKLLYSTSDDTIGIQVCDLLCYPVWHICEYNKKPEDYGWFRDVSAKKLCTCKDGKTDGCGIKFFPRETKNTLLCAESFLMGIDQ